MLLDKNFIKHGLLSEKVRMPMNALQGFRIKPQIQVQDLGRFSAKCLGSYLLTEWPQQMLFLTADTTD